MTLAEAVAAGRPAAGVRIWHLVQAGFVLSGPEATVAVDPWLSDWLEVASPANPSPERRARPAPVAPAELTGLDAVLVTHEHPDHLDPGGIGPLARANPGAQVVVPKPAAAVTEAYGVPPAQLVPVEAGQRLDVAGVPVAVVAAAHAFAADGIGGYDFWRADDGALRAVGYVVELGGLRVFHSGDTVWWPGLERELADLRVDVALLPINGRDFAREQRGLVGNLTSREAADLAAAAGVRLLVPMHFDGVVGNTGHVDELVRYARSAHPTLPVHALAEGEGFLFR